MRTLLASDEPEPYLVSEPARSSPYMVICDHAGNRVPQALGMLGLAPHDLERHIAWDLGAGELARTLGRELDAWVILQPYSRLVVDCNRPLTSPESVVRESDGSVIPRNLGMPEEEAQLRAVSIFEPYHARIRRELDERAARSQRAVLIFLHTFTPVLAGAARRWHAGVLHHHDERLAFPILHALRSEPDLVVGDNEPYAASEATDWGLVEHGERRGLPCVELEIRQDLLESSQGVAVWASRIARCVRGAAVVSSA